MVFLYSYIFIYTYELKKIIYTAVRVEDFGAGEFNTINVTPWLKQVAAVQGHSGVLLSRSAGFLSEARIADTKGNTYI